MTRKKNQASGLQSKMGRAAAVALLLCAAGPAQDRHDPSVNADLVLTNGKILTVDKAFSIAEAVAIKEGKILAVGKKEDIAKFTGSDTKTINLQGKTMLPGINDSHLHFQWMSTSKYSPDTSYQFAVKALLGFDGPSSGKSAVLPELAGTFVPGAPSMAHDTDSQYSTIEGESLSRDKEKDKAALVAAMNKLNTFGITSITDGGISEECYKLLQELHKEGKLTVRINALWAFSSRTENSASKIKAGLDKAGIFQGNENNWLNVIGLKIGADNLPNDKTAWMREDYKTGGNGKLYYPGNTHEERVKAMTDLIAKAHKMGYQVGVHATGDQSIKTLVDCYANLEKEQPKGLRHYIIHGDYTPIEPDLLKVMVEYGIGVAIQPGLALIVGHGMDKNIKQEVFARYSPAKALVQAGVHVSGGSDAPIIDPDWKVAIQSSVTRKAGRGSGMFKGPFPDVQLGATQALTIQEAIRLYTVESAWQERKDSVKGSIEVGKLADFCVVDKDILNTEPSKIQDIKTLMTLVDGKVVFDALPKTGEEVLPQSGEDQALCL